MKGCGRARESATESSREVGLWNHLNKKRYKSHRQNFADYSSDLVLLHVCRVCKGGLSPPSWREWELCYAKCARRVWEVCHERSFPVRTCFSSPVGMTTTDGRSSTEVWEHGQSSLWSQRASKMKSFHGPGLLGFSLSSLSVSKVKTAMQSCKAHKRYLWLFQPGIETCQ